MPIPFSFAMSGADPRTRTEKPQLLKMGGMPDSLQIGAMRFGGGGWNDHSGLPVLARGSRPPSSLRPNDGAQGEPRTRTALRPPPPQDGVSAYSTTWAKYGADCPDRTDDLLFTKQLLCQLS